MLIEDATIKMESITEHYTTKLCNPNKIASFTNKLVLKRFENCAVAKRVTETYSIILII